MGHQIRAQEGQSVPQKHGNGDVRRREEDARQIAALTVDQGIEQDQQQKGKAGVHGRVAHNPRPLALLHPDEEDEGHERQQQIHQMELVNRSLEIHLQLQQKTERIGKNVAGIRLLVLAAGEGVDEPVERARVAQFIGGLVADAIGM